MTAPAVPSGYQAVLVARSGVVEALDDVNHLFDRLRAAQDRLEHAIEVEARAANTFAGYDLPVPRRPD